MTYMYFFNNILFVKELSFRARTVRLPYLHNERNPSLNPKASLSNTNFVFNLATWKCPLANETENTYIKIYGE